MILLFFVLKSVYIFMPWVYGAKKARAMAPGPM